MQQYVIQSLLTGLIVDGLHMLNDQFMIGDMQ
jgi:hypothetical protein